MTDDTRHISLNDPSTLDLIVALNARVRSDLDEVEQDITAREVEAARMLAECADERKRVERKREHLNETETLYRAHFEGTAGLTSSQARELETLDRAIGIKPESAGGEEQDGKKTAPKARIGDQRYAMFHVMRTISEPVLLVNIENITGLSTRRIKEQMAEDTAAGFVKTYADGHAFTLTPEGHALMIRFEQSRRARGLPLPALVKGAPDDVADEEGSAEGSSEDPATET